jgi:carboxylesterase type B
LRVTIMGESAGGGSVLHQITAFGGNVAVVSPSNKPFCRVQVGSQTRTLAFSRV